MKNIFKLASVFMAIALLVSTLLLTGALVSAGEKNLLVNGDFKVLPDVGAAKPYDVEGFGWKDGGIIAGESTFADGSFTLKNGNSGAKGFYQAIAFDTETEYTLTLNVTVTSSTLDVRLYDSTGKSNLKSIVKYDAGTVGEQTVKFTPVDGAARIYLGGSNVLFTITSAVLTDGTTEETTAASASETEVTATEAEPTVTEAEPTVTETEPTATATATEAEPTATATATEAEPTATEAEPTATEAEPTATEAEPTATEAEPTATEAEPTATEAEPTVTEAEPTVTEAEPTATEAEPTATEAEPTEPVSLVETVLVENNVGGTKALKPEKTDAWFLVVNEIKADVAANGPIDPDKGEYYQIIVTGSVDNGEADFHLGEGLDWNEYWGESGSITTEPSTVVATIPVAIPAEGIGDVYLADSGEAGHILSWTYAKVSVFRVGETTEPVVTETEPAATETEPVATETEPAATETEPAATETEPVATETEPAATETEPVATETEPAATETGTDGVLLGDANGDGQINLKDVLAARKYVAGMDTEIDLAAADVNFDDAVNMKDILLIRKYIAGMITSFIE